MQAEGDETNNTSVEEPPQEGEAAENKEEGAVEEKVIELQLFTIYFVIDFWLCRSPLATSQKP